MELVDSAISRPNCEDLSLFSRRFLIPAAQPEMKLDLRAPCWITARRRNRELNCTLYIRTVLSFRFVSFQRPRFHVEALGIAKEREREREKQIKKRQEKRDERKKKRKEEKKLRRGRRLIKVAARRHFIPDPLVFRICGARFDVENFNFRQRTQPR